MRRTWIIVTAGLIALAAVPAGATEFDEDFFCMPESAEVAYRAYFEAAPDGSEMEAEGRRIADEQRRDGDFDEEETADLLDDAAFEWGYVYDCDAQAYVPDPDGDGDPGVTPPPAPAAGSPTTVTTAGGAVAPSSGGTPDPGLPQPSGAAVAPTPTPGEVGATPHAVSGPPSGEIGTAPRPLPAPAGPKVGKPAASPETAIGTESTTSPQGVPVSGSAEAARRPADDAASTEAVRRQGDTNHRTIAALVALAAVTTVGLLATVAARRTRRPRTTR